MTGIQFGVKSIPSVPTYFGHKLADLDCNITTMESSVRNEWFEEYWVTIGESIVDFKNH